MGKQKLYTTLNYFIASVWLINGLFCKVLNAVSRHTEIVERILGTEYARPLTILIGFLEIVMAMWVVSLYKKRLNAIIQIVIVITMNVLEFTYVQDLLLWGRYNLFFALLFSMVVYYNEFILRGKLEEKIK